MSRGPVVERTVTKRQMLRDSPQKPSKDSPGQTGSGWRGQGMVFKGDRISGLQEDKKVLEMDGGDARVTVRTHLRGPVCSVVGVADLRLCVLP